jgi:hypothetical protein
MGKTSKGRSRTPPIEVGRQAPNDVWSPKELLAALKNPSQERKQQLLREGGILDSKGRIAKKYRSWGNRVSRTAFPMGAK